MEELTKVFVELKESVDEIEKELEIAGESGFSYSRAKKIRKAAQTIKLRAQDIRMISSDLYKEKK